MIPTEIQEQLQAFADQASSKAEEYSGTVGSIKELIVQHFGQNGLIAAYIALAVLLLLLFYQLAKIGFSTVKYLIIPSIGIAMVVHFATSYSFFMLLPVTVVLFSLVLLFRG
ncbi:MAG: hypothetical protein U9N55_04350 [candidate division Zixibacteria bacterium]|nr:hypothetical protein [candidate division Zixibacteria bacterium]